MCAPSPAPGPTATALGDAAPGPTGLGSGLGARAGADVRDAAQTPCLELPQPNPKPALLCPAAAAVTEHGPHVHAVLSPPIHLGDSFPRAEGRRPRVNRDAGPGRLLPAAPGPRPARPDLQARGSRLTSRLVFTEL